MFRYLKHAEIDKANWDACLNNAENGIIYGLSWYLDIVSPGWDALVKVVNGTYDAIMPLPVRKKFGLLSYLNQPVFTQQSGVFYTTKLTPADWAQLSEILKQHFRFITSYAFNTANAEILSGSLPDFATQIFTTHLLNLNKPYPEIVKGYRQDRRWRLNKAKNLNLQVTQTTDIELMLAIFDKNTAPRIYGVAGESYEYPMLRKLYQAAAEKQRAEIYQISDENGTVLAMAMFFYYRNQIIYIFNTSTAQGKKNGAIAVLLDTMFKKWAGNELIFDFESAQVAGVADFYKSFGAAEVPFVGISFNNLPPLINAIKQFRMKLYRTLLQ